MFIYLKSIKFLLISLIVILINGCSSTNMKDFENKTPKLNLFEFFKGETVAYGIFEDRFGKLRRQFRVKIKGSVEENILTLDEKFIYDDGEKATRIWKIKKIVAFAPKILNKKSNKKYLLSNPVSKYLTITKLSP